MSGHAHHIDLRDLLLRCRCDEPGAQAVASEVTGNTRARDRSLHGPCDVPAVHPGLLESLEPIVAAARERERPKRRPFADSRDAEPSRTAITGRLGVLGGPLRPDIERGARAHASRG
jgi:hypothetical protein